MYLDHQQLSVAPTDELDLGDEPRRDAVGDQVHQSLLQGQRVVHPNHSSGPVRHADNQLATSGVGERDDRAQHRQRRREIAFELKLLSFRHPKQLIHSHTQKSSQKSQWKLHFRADPTTALLVRFQRRSWHPASCPSINARVDCPSLSWSATRRNPDLGGTREDVPPRW